MITLESQRMINNLDQLQKSRVKFSQFTWLCLIVLAVFVGLSRGAPVWLGVSVGIVFALPVLVWAMLYRRGNGPSAFVDDLYICIWALIALVGMSLGGGALSPLTAVLVLGPLASLALGRYIIVSHTAMLGLLAYALAIFAGILGWTRYVPADWQILSAPLAVAALVQAVIFTWAFDLQMWRGLATQREASKEVSASKAIEARAATQIAEDQTIGLTLPILLVYIASEGRIKRVEGAEHLRWDGLVPGKIAETVLGQIEEGRYTSPIGDEFEVLSKDLPCGARWVGFVPASADPAEIEALSLSLAQAQSDISKAEQDLSDRTAFFAGLGHDLKTPLNAILGFADLMKAEVRGPMPEGYKDYPAIIHESGQDLMLLVDDILDLAKSEASGHSLDMEPVDLVASAASVMRQLEDQADRTGVKLVLRESGEVWADADARAVRQIWQNLISNAIKYSERGGTVTLSAGKAAGSVALSVKDRGAGMDQEDLDRVATPFMQGSNSKGRAGTGLGLAVVHRFAELHGGKVVIETEKGKGTQVRVTLPALSFDQLSGLEDAAQ